MLFRSAALGELALHAVDTMAMGQDDVPDLLWVSFSTIDVIGHNYGYESLERSAALWSLDRTLGLFLAGLDTRVGHDNVRVVLLADHGMSLLPETLQLLGKVGGRVDIEALSTSLEAGLQKKLGPLSAGGHYVAKLVFPFVTLADPFDADVRVQRETVAFLNTQPFVYKAWRNDELDADKDEAAKLMRESVYPGRCGQVSFVLKPGFIPMNKFMMNSGGAHGSPWIDDRYVPTLFWGAGVTPGRHFEAIDVIDVMRTVADGLGLPPMPHAGVSLSLR